MSHSSLCSLSHSSTYKMTWTKSAEVQGLCLEGKIVLGLSSHLLQLLPSGTGWIAVRIHSFLHVLQIKMLVKPLVRESAGIDCLNDCQGEHRDEFWQSSGMLRDQVEHMAHLMLFYVVCGSLLSSQRESHHCHPHFVHLDYHSINMLYPEYCFWRKV